MENKETLKQEFLKANPLYQRLSFNITESLKFLLKDSGIPYLDVYSRVKEFDSFFDKIDRKQYKNHLIKLKIFVVYVLFVTILLTFCKLKNNSRRICHCEFRR